LRQIIIESNVKAIHNLVVHHIREYFPLSVRNQSIYKYFVQHPQTPFISRMIHFIFI